jgi:pyruvate/2-oxoglutarate dehydrogenase complex dihydrolipoamide dehydrogenase (E3) component
MKEDTNTIVETPEMVREAEIIAGIHAHPTLSEAVMEAALSAFGKLIHI